MYNFFAPVLVFLPVSKIETYHFFFISVEVLNLVGDESDSNFSEINKEVIFFGLFVDEEIHVVVFKHTVKVDFLDLVVGYLAVPTKVIFLSNILHIGLYEVVEFLPILSKNIKPILHFGQ